MIRDVSRNANHSDIVGSLSWSGRGRLIGANNSYFGTNDVAMSNSSGSIVVWGTWSGTSNQYIHGSSSAHRMYLGVTIGTSTLQMNKGGGIFGSIDLVANKPFIAVVTWTANANGATSLYVDGVLSGTGGNYDASPFADLKMMAVTTTGGEWYGELAEGLYYDRPLKLSEIRQLSADPQAPFRRKTQYLLSAEEALNTYAYTALQSSNPSYSEGYARNAAESVNSGLWRGLVGAWNPTLTGNTGSIVRDISVNNNNGSIVGDLAWSGRDGLTGADNSYFRTTDTVMGDGPGAVVVWGVWDGSTASTQIIHGSSTDHRIYLGVVTPDSNLTMTKGDGVPFGSIDLVANKPFLAVATWGENANGATSLYVDGILSGTGGDYDASSVSEMQFMSLTATIGEWFGGFKMGLYYDRALTFSEIQQLSTDPQAPFRKKSQYLLSGEESLSTYAYTALQSSRPSYSEGYASSQGQSVNEGLWAGLVGAWNPSLGVTGTTLRDVSGNHNHGTLTDADVSAAWQSDYMEFDGTNDRVLCGDIKATEGIGQLTVLARVWFNDTGNGGIVSKRHTTSSESWFMWRLSNKLYIRVTGVSTPWVSGNLTLPTNEWISVCFTYNKTDALRSYINGTQDDIDSAVYSDVGTSTEEVVLGWSYNNGYALNGRIQNAYIWDRALSPSEIQQLYVDPHAPFRRKQQYFLNSEPATGDVTVLPDAQTLTLTLPAPTIDIIGSVTVSPAAQSLTLTQPAPTIDISGNITLTPAAQSLTLTQPSPTISIINNATVTPATQVLSLTQQTPTISIIEDVTVSPAAQSLTLAQPVLTVDISSDVTVTPAAQTLTLTQPAPTVDIVQGITVTPSALSLTLTQPAPVIDIVQSVTVTPAAQTLTLIQQAPVVDTGVELENSVNFTLSIDTSRSETLFIDQEKTFTMEL